MKYDFDFGKATIGDLRALSSGNASMLELIEFLDKVVVGGVLGLPVTEFHALVQMALAEFGQWLRPAEDTNSLEDLLKDIKL